MQIAVVYSTPTRRSLASPFSATDEDTRVSAMAVAKALTAHTTVELVPITEDTIRNIQEIRADCIFNLIEWDGLDIALALTAFERLELLRIPFTGVSKSALEGISDKIRMKKALVAAGLSTPKWQLFETGSEAVDPALPFPAIVKPLYEHCSVGLTHETVVTDAGKLRKIVKKQMKLYNQPVFAEEFIIGREFQVTVLERKTGPLAFPPAEIVFTTSGMKAFLTYGSRWVREDPDWMTSNVVLASIPPILRKQLEDVSIRAFKALNYRDYSRLDIRVREDAIFILEANANPGVEDSTGYGMSVSFHAAGMNFGDFLWEIVASALRRK